MLSTRHSWHTCVMNCFHTGNCKVPRFLFCTLTPSFYQPFLLPFFFLSSPLSFFSFLPPFFSLLFFSIPPLPSPPPLHSSQGGRSVTEEDCVADSTGSQLLSPTWGKSHWDTPHPPTSSHPHTLTPHTSHLTPHTLTGDP